MDFSASVFAVKRVIAIVRPTFLAPCHVGCVRSHTVGVMLTHLTVRIAEDLHDTEDTAGIRALWILYLVKVKMLTRRL